MDVRKIQNYYNYNISYCIEFYLQTNGCKKGIVLDDTCAFCNTETESLERVFLECTFVTSFWSEVLKWLKKYQSWRQVLLGNEEIILGFNMFFNMLILYFVKFYYIKC